MRCRNCMSKVGIFSRIRQIRSSKKYCGECLKIKARIVKKFDVNAFNFKLSQDTKKCCFCNSKAAVVLKHGLMFCIDCSKYVTETIIKAQRMNSFLQIEREINNIGKGGKFRNDFN